jgi:hypothetical protein
MGRAAPNTPAKRVLTGEDEYEWLMKRQSGPRFHGPAIAFGYTEAFGGRLKRLTGTQRVAIESAAYGE